MNHVNEMLALLSEESRVLTSGDYAALPDLVARKEALEQALRSAPEPDGDTLAVIAEAVARNAALIEAARRGIEQARVQIREIRAGMTQATYGRTGDRTSLTRSPSRIEQKL